MITLKPKKPEHRAPVVKSPYFAIENEDGVPVIYEAPDELTAAEALIYVRLSAEQDVDTANMWLLRHALGETGYHAVTTFQDLGPDDLAGILGGLIDRVHKALKPGKNGPNGS